MKSLYHGTISTTMRTFDTKRSASQGNIYLPPLGRFALATVCLSGGSGGQCFILRFPSFLATFTEQLAIRTTKSFMVANATGLQRPSATPTVKLSKNYLRTMTRQPQAR